MNIDLTALKAIVGDPHVIADEPSLELLSRTSITERHIPRIIIFPENADQVQKIIGFANTSGYPVWPVSRGNNWGYGSASAGYPGGITMVLSRMSKIVDVNESLGYAVIEPGVTYQQLNDYLKKHHPGLWADTAGSTVNASVIGNALDHGRGLTPYADHFGCLCGMDVILPNGSYVQTGGGPVDNYPARHTYKWGVGPYLDGLFAQSNLGIVVRAGIWLMPKPEKFDFFVFEYTAKETNFPAFLDDFRALLFKGVIKSHPHFANDFAMMCIVDQYPHDLLKPGETRLSAEALKIWKKKLGVAEWTFGCALYGSKVEIKAHRGILNKVLGKYGQLVFVGGCDDDTLRARITLWAAKLVLRLQGKSPKLLEGLPDAIRLFKGIPTDYFVRQVYCKSHKEKPPVGQVNPPRDGCGFIWIGPLLPYDTPQILEFLKEMHALYDQFGFDYFIELMPESARCMMTLFGIFYDKKNAEESARARALYDALHDLSYQRGYPPYRTTIMSTNTLMDCNPPLQDALNGIKNAWDPNNILAPGRYGISGKL